MTGIKHMTRRPTTHAAAEPLKRDWRTQSACRDDDPELFFPVGISAEALRQTERAKAVCKRCPVMDECLSWALETRQETGVWGGQSETERIKLSSREPRRPSRPRPRPSLERCISQQSYIEGRLAKGVSKRRVAKELDVGGDALRRAVKFFQDERAGVAS